MPEHTFNAVVFGPAASGKTSLVRRYTDNVFSPNYRQTIGTDYANKSLSIYKSVIDLKFKDVSGMEQFSSMLHVYYKNTNAVVLVFDYSGQTSVNPYNFVKKYVIPYIDEDVPIILVASKADLLTEEQKQRAEKELNQAQQQFASPGRYVSVAYTSAKDGTSVKDVFDGLAHTLLQTQPVNPSADPEPQQPETIILDDIDEKKPTWTGFFAYLGNHLKTHPWRYAIGLGLALGVAAVLAIPGIGQAAGLAWAVGYLFVSTGVQLGLFAAGIALCTFLASVLIGMAADKIHQHRRSKIVADSLGQESKGYTPLPTSGSISQVDKQLDPLFQHPANMNFTRGTLPSTLPTSASSAAVTTANSPSSQHKRSKST